MRTVRVLVKRHVLIARRHAHRAVEADDLAVEIAVVDAMHHQRGEFARLAQALGERHRGAERILRLLRQRAQHRRAENARRDRQHADAEWREFARRRQRQRGDAALGRRIGGLADLAFEGGDRSGRDDHAALAVGEAARAAAWRRRRAASC